MYVNKKYTDFSLRSQNNLPDDRKVKEIIITRKDGFIYNAINEGIYYGNSNAIAYIKTLGEISINELKKNHPALSKKLMI